MLTIGLGRSVERLRRLISEMDSKLGPLREDEGGEWCREGDRSHQRAG